jgi:hypothetical protein
LLPLGKIKIYNITDLLQHDTGKRLAMKTTLIQTGVLPAAANLFKFLHFKVKRKKLPAVNCWN